MKRKTERQRERERGRKREKGRDRLRLCEMGGGGGWRLGIKKKPLRIEGVSSGLSPQFLDCLVTIDVTIHH